MNGKQLRAERRKRGLTQVQLAEASEVSKGTIANWELEKFEPEPGTIKKVALALRKFPVVIDLDVDIPEEATPAA